MSITKKKPALKTRVKQFIDDVTSVRSSVKVDIEDDHMEVIVDGIKVLSARELEHCIHTEMLPDVYTYSNWESKIVVGTIHFNGHGDTCINFDVKEVDFGDLLDMVKDAIIDLNLYGYTYE